MDRFVFTCSKCLETIIVPGDSQHDAAQFLLQSTPWAGKASTEGTALLCPKHSDVSVEDLTVEGDPDTVTEGSIRDRHFCKWERRDDREVPVIFGKQSITHFTCVEAGDGRFWLDICEDLVLVRACPICGSEAKVREPPLEVPVVGEFNPNDPSSVAAYAMRSGKVSRGVPAARWVVQSHCSTVKAVAHAIGNGHHRGATGIGFSTARGMEELFEQRYAGEFEAPATDQ